MPEGALSDALSGSPLRHRRQGEGDGTGWRSWWAADAHAHTLEVCGEGRLGGFCFWEGPHVAAEAVGGGVYAGGDDAEALFGAFDGPPADVVVVGELAELSGTAGAVGEDRSEPGFGLADGFAERRLVEDFGGALGDGCWFPNGDGDVGVEIGWFEGKGVAVLEAADVVFGGEEESAFGADGVLRDEPDGAGGCGEAESAVDAGEGGAGHRACEVGDADDGRVVFGGDDVEWCEESVDFGRVLAADVVQVTGDGVDDDEGAGVCVIAADCCEG